MSRAERSKPKAASELRRGRLAELSPIERAWLEDRLQEYRELLDYLRDH
jgi:hypothetical protein